MSRRFLWVVVLVVSLVASIVMVCTELGRNGSDLTLTALDTAHYPVWNIYFPAVTLCGLNRIKKSRAITMTNKWYVIIILHFVPINFTGRKFLMHS
jgi:hypothetical protein